MFSSLACLLLAADIATGTWAARLDSPQGPLPFGLMIKPPIGSSLSAYVFNGRERINVPVERGNDGRYVFDFPHYAARLVATLDESGRALNGEWTKRSGPLTSKTLPFHATWSNATVGIEWTGGDSARPGRISLDAATTERIAKISGRWRVRFEKDAEPAVGVFEYSTNAPGGVEGTFLTPTGDFRYLAGSYDEHLLLTCFDGAHAFRFEADLQSDGSLKGRYCAGDSYTDTWTAVRDDSAKLPDEFGRVHWDESYAWNDLLFPSVWGGSMSLGDRIFDGKVRVLQITGSWCPNCHDETALLVELQGEYERKGLQVAALCFELTGESLTDTRASQSMLTRHRATYPALLVGRSDKKLASEALPALDRVFAFPTTVFVGRDGRVRAVHTGFSGPATGDAHQALRADFRRRIEELLAEKPAEDEALRERITHELWRDEMKRTFTTLARDEAGTWRYSALEMTRFDGPTRTDVVESGKIEFAGTTVRLGEKAWTYDRRAHVLLDPSDCGARFTPAARSPFPVVDGVGYSEFAQVLEGLSSGNPIRRRESAYYLALQIQADRTTPPEFGGGQIPGGTDTNLAPLLADPDPRVRATASWAVGAVGLSTALAALEKNLSHGYAPVRREAARALKVLDPKAARESLAPLVEHDIDPLVRAAAAR